MNKISNWFHNARMRAKPNNQISMSPLNENETDDDPDENNLDDDDDDDDDTLPTIVPLNSSWLNGTHDSDSSNSPISYSNQTNTSDFKPLSSISTSSSSSKKRKSIPQKIITTKKLYIDPTTENDQSEELNP